MILNTLIYLINESEGIITFFYIIATVSLIYRRNCRAFQRWREIILSTILFSIIFKPVENAFANYYFYILFTLLSAFLFCFLNIRDNLWAAAALLVYLMYSVVSFKGVLASIFNTLSGSVLISEDSLRCIQRLFLYAFFALFCMFFQLHPICPRTKLPRSYWLSFLLAPFSLVLCLEWFTQKYASVADPTALRAYICLTFSLFVTYYLSYIIIQNYESMINTSFLNLKLQLQVDYMKQSSSMITQVRKERHELKNNYFYIQSLIKSGKYNELERFLDVEMGQRFTLLEEFNTGNKLVDYILTQKVNEARSSDIHIMVNALLPSQLSVAENDLCALLLNLLDNAIEASIKEKQRDIHVAIGIAKQYLSVQIKNLSSENIMEKNPQLLTGKADAAHHGLGLQIVRSIVNKYDGMFETCMENGYFLASALLRLQ